MTLFEKIYLFEKKNNLLELSFKNVKIWQYLRVNILNIIFSQQSNTFQRVLDSNTKRRSIYKIIKNIIFYNPFFKKIEQNVVFLHPRKVKLEDEIIDIYTYDLFHKDGFTLIDNSYDDDFETEYSRNTIFSILMVVIRFFIKFKFTNEERVELAKIEKIIVDEFSTNIELESMFVKYIKTFLAFKILYKLFFKIKKVKKIYIVVNYGQAPLIAAAKEMDIEVIEFQHGIISPQHFGYSFPYNKRIDYFPNKLIVFGEFFRNLDFIPLERNSIEIGNYKYFQLSKLTNKQKTNSTKLLIISDAGNAGGKYQEFILNNRNFLKKYDKVSYKLHPIEVHNSAYRSAQYLKGLSDVDNLEFIEEQKKLYEEISSSDCVISYSSTVIFESLEMGKIVIIPKFDDYDSLKNLEEYVYFVGLDERIVLPKIKEQKFKKGFFIKALS